MSQTLIDLNDPSAGSVAPYAQLGDPAQAAITQYPKGMEVRGHSHSPILTLKKCYASENTKPHHA